MTTAKKNPPPAPENPPNNLPPPAPAAGVDSGSAPNPGEAELRALADQGEQAPATDTAPPPGIPAPREVLPHHRLIAADLVGGLLTGLEGGLPIRYSAETRGEGVDVVAPLIAKHEHRLPLWYLQYREEITAGRWAVEIAVKTAREVSRVNAIEAEIRELAKEYRERKGLTPREARQQAVIDLGYDAPAGNAQAGGSVAT